MSKKKEEAKPPSLDELTVKDLASLFILSGLLTHTKAMTTDHVFWVKKANEIADTWVKERTA